MRFPIIFLLFLFLHITIIQAQTTSNRLVINWLDQTKPKFFNGNTFGIPWPKGTVNKNLEFQLTSNDGNTLPTQSWPIAYWPDGSVKWSAIAVAPGENTPSEMHITTGISPVSKHPIKITETRDEFIIRNGSTETIVAKKGFEIIKSIKNNGITTAQNGHLVLLKQNTPENYGEKPVATTTFKGSIHNVELEQDGPVRALIKIEGKHISENNNILVPFTIRLYFYAGSNNIRIMHTMIYDGDENLDFIRGIGFRFSVPMHQTEQHNRHIRFTGEEGGLFAEAVKGLTGLRREPSKAIKQAQLNGKSTPPVEEFPGRVQKGLPYIPSFGDYTLFQSSPHSFSIKKRTDKEHTWLNSAQGNKSTGTGYLGTPIAGMAFGIRNFWQSYPAQLDIRHANTELAQATMWLWAPDASAMDLRFYHDGLDMDTYEKQWEGLEITYEDYEPGFGRPIGVARTSEMNICSFTTPPTREEIVAYGNSVANPPILMANMEHIQNSGVFGQMWNVKKESPASATVKKISERLDWLFDYYQLQIKQYNWYGFWDFGDVMHTYDSDRHVWRYDVGGYAWDNSELATDIWLWYYFLHSGRADAFRMAEAMTRHTGEVDVHHLGPFAPLGSRHNVLHWGCSAKQMRISTVANRRFYYFLTADERVGDLMDEQLDAHKALLDVPPLRKRVKFDRSDTTKVAMSFGTDWGAVASAWLTDWERTGDKHSYTRLLNSMKTIAYQPHGFFTGIAMMDVESGKFEIADHTKINVSHLNAVFGLAELCAELIDLFDMPEFEQAWLQYCELYNAPQNEQKKALGDTYRNHVLYQGHSRLTAYVAMKNKNSRLAKRAWNEFTLQDPHKTLSIPLLQEISVPNSLHPIKESPEISTNYAAQWGLAALQLMKLLEDELPKDF